jgi:hypothetical protein
MEEYKDMLLESAYFQLATLHIRPEEGVAHFVRVGP